MKENPNIDELLNGFLDDELNPRQRTEVQRLISHDPKVAQRLADLERCRMLVSSLPGEEPPKELAGEIKNLLERKILLGLHEEQVDHKKGARHLFIRKTIAAAAMIGLVAALGVVIYNIVAPVPAPKKKPVMANDQPVINKAAREEAKPVEVVAKTAAPQERIIADEFDGRLELNTSKPEMVSAFVSKAAGDNGISARTDSVGRMEYSLRCTKSEMNKLLTSLQHIWPELKSATLDVRINRLGGDIVVDSVKAEQVIEIINQGDIESCVKAAKYFAIVNNMSELTPNKEIFAKIDGNRPDEMAIPKPVLTSNEKEPQKAEQSNEIINLTIAVVPVSAEKVE
jgi:hypothetical protein